MLLSVVSATVAVRTIKPDCLVLVEIKHLKMLLITFLIFSQKLWEIFQMSLFYSDTCQVSPDSRCVVLSLMKTSQHKFTCAESRWFHLDSYFDHGRRCGVEEWNDSPCKRANRNERGFHSSANEERGEILPRAGLLLINWVLTSARSPSFLPLPVKTADRAAVLLFSNVTKHHNTGIQRCSMCIEI